MVVELATPCNWVWSASLIVSGVSFRPRGMATSLGFGRHHFTTRICCMEHQLRRVSALPRGPVRTLVQYDLRICLGAFALAHSSGNLVDISPGREYPVPSASQLHPRIALERTDRHS